MFFTIKESSQCSSSMDFMSLVDLTSVLDAIYRFELYHLVITPVIILVNFHIDNLLKCIRFLLFIELRQ